MVHHRSDAAQGRRGFTPGLVRREVEQREQHQGTALVELPFREAELSERVDRLVDSRHRSSTCKRRNELLNQRIDHTLVVLSPAGSVAELDQLIDRRVSERAKVGRVHLCMPVELAEEQVDDR